MKAHIKRIKNFLIASSNGSTPYFLTLRLRFVTPRNDKLNQIISRSRCMQVPSTIWITFINFHSEFGRKEKKKKDKKKR